VHRVQIICAAPACTFGAGTAYQQSTSFNIMADQRLLDGTLASAVVVDVALELDASPYDFEAVCSAYQEERDGRIWEGRGGARS